MKGIMTKCFFFSNSVLQGESVQNSTYNIFPKASDTEIPKKPLTSDVYAKIVKVLISLSLKLQCSSWRISIVNISSFKYFKYLHTISVKYKT